MENTLILAIIDVVLVDSLETLRKLNVCKNRLLGRGVVEVAEGSERRVGIVGGHVAVEGQDDGSVANGGGDSELRRTNIKKYSVNFIFIHLFDIYNIQSITRVFRAPALKWCCTVLFFSRET